MRQQHKTIRDIARLAQVSIATVSRVINQKPDVDPQTRRRILAIIAEVGFQPTPAAVVLATAKHAVAAPQSSFPADFLWGCATSAFQIEGALHEDGRGPSIWDDFVAYPPPDFTPQTAATASDHYHHMPEDVALLQQLGVNAYRFSVAWPRVMPEGKGRVNAQGLDFYERLVDALLAAEIEPLITLYHWDLPLALQAQYGGWLHRDVAQLFADYAEQVVRRLGDRVSWWMTINEPWSVAVHGYAWGSHPPHAQDSAQTLQVAHHLLLAHGFAIERMRQQSKPATKIGIALNLSPIYPADQRAATLQAAQNAHVWYNLWMLDPLFRGQYPAALATQDALAAVIQSDDLKTIAAPIDFLGVNYYSRLVVKAASSPSTDILTGFTPVVPVPEASYSQMGWETYAEGLRDILATIHDHYHPPLLLVTENGAAYTDEYTDLSERIHDHRRVAYLQEHLAALQRALQQGIPIKGYCAWTLMDNFEWTDGYHQRFGLAAVHPETHQRILKESGHWYAHFIAAQREAANAASASDSGTGE